ncbi:hypothetical protein NW768_009981 [Fusarium equiseti]|uniref:Enoyl reductase (ER) domain-containing protein n=1 Tax=Fusarium equiseti TaxID=61235 RepID=A0ABQ8R1A4_FUSEQ|nr:hypothetical protein NW768_009981 [Fusarium equiseti]
MKAILQPDKHSHNLILTDQPLPTPSHPQDVLVRVHATSPCKGELDWALWAPDFIGDKTPIPGQDLAGTVVSASQDSRFQPGDEVYARIEANRPGAAAEYVLAHDRELAIRPRNLSWAETAACPISALTAYQALFRQGTLITAALEGDEEARKKNAHVRLLINGASGGVGSWAVQLARIAGVETVAAVAGTGNIDFVKDLGATDTIDYKEQSIERWIDGQPSRQFDLVIDCIGGPSLAQTWYAVREGGSLISVCGPPEQSRPENMKKEVHNLFFVIDPFGRDLDLITKVVEAGKVKPNIDSVVGMDDFAQAWEKVESGKTRGKIVVMISEE